jgi:hypothetical protein
VRLHGAIVAGLEIYGDSAERHVFQRAKMLAAAIGAAYHRVVVDAIESRIRLAAE